jgi:hypothetical protein
LVICDLINTCTQQQEEKQAVHAVPLIPFLLELRFFSLLFLVIAQLVLNTKKNYRRMSTAITYE